MKRFNLIPAHIIKKQKRRKTIAILSIVQVLILMFIVCSFPVIDFISQDINVYSEELTKLISDSKYDESDLLANEVVELHNILVACDDILSSYSPEFFEDTWLNSVNELIPAGVNLLSFEFLNGYLSLNCETKNLILAEKHRNNLIDYGLNAALGTITTYDGLYIYTLHTGAV